MSLFCCINSLTNLKHHDSDLKQILCSAVFAVMGLVSNYMKAEA